MKIIFLMLVELIEVLMNNILQNKIFDIVSIFIFNSNSPKGNRPEYVFDAHTCFNYMNLFNSTEPITNEYIHNVLYGETGIQASN